jgi:hypothetical protein
METVEIMMNPRHTPIPRNRYLVLTGATAAIGLISAIFLVGAPPLPAILGVAIAASWLIWRAPAV